MASNRKVRIKKLAPKTLLPVLREDQIDPSEYEQLTSDSQIVTGVDQSEENEYHLQAALKGVGASTDNEIPVPPPQESEMKYEDLYPKPYAEPRNYIKSSETVEETLSCLYDMTTEDETWLKTYNTGKKPASAQLSEDDFERIMEVFEDTASEHAPFASVDNTVVAYETMVQSLSHVVQPKLVQTHGSSVFEYWKSRRLETGNKLLHPSLKFETHQESDDMDPYVCFRRREVRQTRKTRQRDVQVADKLKKLRRELEDGRQLVVWAHQREILKREVLKSERMLFEQRARLKEHKVRLNIKGDDDDLINTKPQKRPRTEPAQPRTGGPHTQLRLQVRPDGRQAEQLDLVQLSDKQAEKENELRHDIETKVQNHRRWNQNYVDLTSNPLPPPKEEQELGFRPAKVQQLMTPPASSASDSMEVDDEGPKLEVRKGFMAPQLADSDSDDSDEGEMFAFRRRVGRGGRLWVDRRPIRSGLTSPPREVDWASNDQWKYDQDDDEDEQPTYDIDPFSLRQMKFRSTIPYPIQLFSRRQGVQALPQAQAQAQAQAHAQAQAQAQQVQAANTAVVATKSATPAVPVGTPNGRPVSGQTQPQVTTSAARSSP